MLKIQEVGINELKPSEYNPRKADKKQCDDLKEGIKRFGLVDPLIVNGSKKRKNIIIGGHFRWRMAKEMGIEKVPVVYVDIKDIEREKELNLRLNKNNGGWDWDLLANFDEKFLEMAGFENSELKMKFGLSDIEKTEVDIERLLIMSVNPPESPKLKERMAFYCDTFKEYKEIVKCFNSGSSYRLDKEKLKRLLSL